MDSFSDFVMGEMVTTIQSGQYKCGHFESNIFILYIAVKTKHAYEKKKKCVGLK